VRGLGSALRRLRKLAAICRNPAYILALRHGTAAAVEHDAAPFRYAFRTIIDVGANRGQFALVAANRFPRAALYCFEPLPEPRRKLERALRGHAKLNVMQCALTAKSGCADFVVSKADDSSSLLEMTETQTRTFPGTGAAYRIRVRTETLDGVLASADLVRPLLLKVDVQGAELDVLRGATAVLQSADSVLVECSFAELYRGQPLAGEVVSFLDSHGFHLDAICTPLLDRNGQVLQADLLFQSSQ
jgi:FkbM family methyltransferase